MSIIPEVVEQLIDELSNVDKKILRRRQLQKEYYQRNRQKKIAQSMANYVHKRKKIEYEIPVVNKKTEFTLIEMLGFITNDQNYTSDSTRKTHISAMNRIFSIVDSLKQLNKNYKSFVNTLENDKGYSVNTIKSTVSSLLAVLDRYKIEIINSKNMKSLVNLYNKYILMSNDEQFVKNENISVPSWSNYLIKAERFFGKASKQYLIASLYHVLSVRDDFANLLFVRMEQVDNDSTKNYLAVDEKDNYYIVLNEYKTANSYKQVEFKLPLKVKRLIKTWLSNNAVLFNQSVFKESSLSPFVTQMHRDLGYGDLGQGAINLFRKMSVSALEGSSYEEKVEKAAEMKHSVLTQKKYNRLLKVEEE
tara:strand:- start:535 stop:1620 length:1086 start_codon:yes stop_codon:yes gene_type:complete